MPWLEKTIKIENEKSQKLEIEKAGKEIRLTNTSDFKDARDWLVSQWIDIFSDDTKIIKKTNKEYLVWKVENNKISKYIIVENKDLLMWLVSYATDHYNRALLRDVMWGEIHNDLTVAINTKIDKTTNEEVEELKLSIKGELHDLENQIVPSPEQIQEAINTLVGWGKYKWEYNEIKELINERRRERKKNSPMYENNLKIFEWIINSQKINHIDTIQRYLDKIEKDQFQQTTPDALVTRKSKLFYIHAQFTNIKRYILDTDLMQKPFDPTIYNTDIAGYSQKDLSKLYSKVNAQNLDIHAMNEIQFNIDLTKIDSDEQQRFRVYLNDVLNWAVDPSKTKFIPTKADDFYDLSQKYPFLNWYIDWKNNAPKEKTSVTNNNVSNNIVIDNKQINNGNQTNNNAPTEHYGNFKEAFEKWWLKWILKKTFDMFPNMTEQQKGSWSEVLFLWWMGFGLFKLWKRFFTWSKNEKGEKTWPWFWWRLGIVWWIFLGSNMLTGKSPIDIINRALTGWLSLDYLKWKWGKWCENASEYTKQTVINPLTTTLILWNKKISELDTIIDKTTFKIKDYDRQMKIAKIANDNDMITLLTQVWKDDPDGILEKWLRQIGITPTNYLSLDQNNTVDDFYEIYIQNITTAESYRTTNNLEVVDSKKDKLTSLITGGVLITDADLEKLNQEWVYKKSEIKTTYTPEDVINRQALELKVDNITNLTEKDKVKEAIKAFYDYLPSDNKNIDLTQTPKWIVFKTYGYETLLDLNGKTVKDFKNASGEYYFDNYFEIFKVANLTNRLKDIFKDKPAITVEPFHVDAKWDIEFDNSEWYRFRTFETTAISAWRWPFKSGLEKISPSIFKDNAQGKEAKENYCKYLNLKVEYKRPAVK